MAASSFKVNLVWFLSLSLSNFRRVAVVICLESADVLT